MIIKNFHISSSHYLSPFTKNDIYIYRDTFKHFEDIEKKEKKKEICIYLILFLESSRNRSTMFISRLEGWKEELVRRLSLHLPSLLSPKPQFSHHHVDFQPSPGPGTGRNRSISSANGIARNHLRRQSNLEAPVGRRDPRSFPPSNGRAGNAHPPLLHRSAPLCCLRGGVDQWHGGNVRLTTWPLEPPPHFPWLTSTTPL